MTRFEKMMAVLQAAPPNPGNQKLIVLFQKHKEAISYHFESCVPDGQEWLNWKPEHCSRNEVHGPMFHKGFRQFDVTNNPEDNVSIWKMLSTSDDGCTFWEAHYESMKDDYDVLKGVGL